MTESLTSLESETIGPKGHLSMHSSVVSETMVSKHGYDARSETVIVPKYSGSSFVIRAKAQFV
jgi:hypothetical protein